MPTTWRVVAAAGLILGIGEAIDSFFIGWGAIASVSFALLFFLGVWLTRRDRLAGPVLIGVMCVLELAVFPGLKRTTTVDWVVQIAFVVVSAIGVVLAAAAVIERRRRPTTPGRVTD